MDEAYRFTELRGPRMREQLTRMLPTLEKADPELRGLYAVINQQFCRQAWAGVDFVNREQDLGEPGLRQAKLSYHPHHLEEKFTLRLA